MIKKYSPTVWDDVPGMDEDRDGSWVKYSDHLAEITRLKSTQAELVDLIEKYRTSDYPHQYAKLEIEAEKFLSRITKED